MREQQALKTRPILLCDDQNIAAACLQAQSAMGWPSLGLGGSSLLLIATGTCDEQTSALAGAKKALPSTEFGTTAIDFCLEVQSVGVGLELVYVDTVYA